MKIIGKFQRYDVTIIVPHDVTILQQDRVTNRLTSKVMGIIEKLLRHDVAIVVPHDVTNFQRDRIFNLVRRSQNMLGWVRLGYVKFAQTDHK